MNYRFGKRIHQGSLTDSLLTSVYITYNEFNSLLKIYEFYTFDERCNQFMFIAKDLTKTDYDWLFIEIINS